MLSYLEHTKYSTCILNKFSEPTATRTSGAMLRTEVRSLRIHFPTIASSSCLCLLNRTVLLPYTASPTCSWGCPTPCLTSNLNIRWLQGKLNYSDNLPGNLRGCRLDQSNDLTLKLLSHYALVGRPSTGSGLLISATALSQRRSDVKTCAEVLYVLRRNKHLQRPPQSI